MNSEFVEEASVDNFLETPTRKPSTGNTKSEELLESPKSNSTKSSVQNGARPSNTKRKTISPPVGNDVEILFDSPPTKSKREEISPLSEIPPDEKYKILTVLSGILILKLCKGCQSGFICNKSRFRFQDGRIRCSVDLCANCSCGNIRARDFAKEPRQIYESDYFKLAKIEYGVIIAKLCSKCEQHLTVDSTIRSDGRTRVEIGFCRACAQNNMNTCDALTKFFPYSKK